jgi:putative acetyltransferase
MTVREATVDDASAILAVHLASIEQLGPAAYTAEQVSAWAHDRNLGDYPIEEDHTHFVVAEREERVVGFGWLEIDPGDYLDASVDREVIAVYVHPSVVREGVGSALLAELEQKACEENAAAVGLWSSLNAVEFYASHDYERVTEHVYEFDAGVEGTVIEMRTDV